MTRQKAIVSFGMWNVNFGARTMFSLIMDSIDAMQKSDCFNKSQRIAINATFYALMDAREKFIKKIEKEAMSIHEQNFESIRKDDALNAAVNRPVRQT